MEHSQHVGGGFSGMRDVLEDLFRNNQIESIEFGERRRQLQALSRYLKLLHQFAGAGAQDPIARVDQGVTNCRS